MLLTYPFARFLSSASKKPTATRKARSNRTLKLRMPNKLIRLVTCRNKTNPITRDDRPAKRSKVDEENLLAVLAENYRVNPGLHMTREDLEEEFELGSEKLDRVMLSLEKKKLVRLHRRREDITLARITYEGLKKAKPAEYYQWFPPWVSREDIF